jgi:signal transduction histidine kinase
MVTDDQLTDEIQGAIARERSRIARDLHDGVAQQLALALLQLEYLQRLLENEATLHQPALAHIPKIAALIQNSLLELRHAIFSSVPLPLVQRDFTLALQDLLASYRNEGWQINYSCDEQLRIPRSLEAPIYRFLREALTNIRKHACASHVTIRVGISSDTLIITVSDDGCGFLSRSTELTDDHPLVNEQHLGLRLMREQIEHLGGQWQLWSQPGQGSTVQIYLPLAG